MARRCRRNRRRDRGIPDGSQTPTAPTYTRRRRRVEPTRTRGRGARLARSDRRRDRRTSRCEQADGRNSFGKHLHQARHRIQDRTDPSSLRVRDLGKSRISTEVAHGHRPYRHRQSLIARSTRGTVMDETKMTEFVERAVGDVGAVLGGAMVVIGDKLGLYRSMTGAGSLTPAELAARTGTVERYVREWLSAQAARGYLSYDGPGDGDGLFSLPDEHAIPLTDE